MESILQNETAIAYTSLFGGRKSNFSDLKEGWRDTHRDQEVNDSEYKLGFGKWLQSCIAPKNLTPEIFLYGGTSSCEYIVDVDKKIKERIKIYLSHEFYGGGLAVPLFISDTEALSPLEVEFNELASQWYRETRKVSSAEQMVLNPSYQKIIGMGKDALPFIFKELQKTRGHWIWALAMILRDDKAKPGMKFREAVDAWLEWGKTNGYINANTRHTIRS